MANSGFHEKQSRGRDGKFIPMPNSGQPAASSAHAVDLTAPPVSPPKRQSKPAEPTIHEECWCGHISRSDSDFMAHEMDHMARDADEMEAAGEMDAMTYEEVQADAWDGDY